jgi:hypothetical protein
MSLHDGTASRPRWPAKSKISLIPHYAIVIHCILSNYCNKLTPLDGDVDILENHYGSLGRLDVASVKILSFISILNLDFCF